MSKTEDKALAILGLLALLAFGLAFTLAAPLVGIWGLNRLLGLGIAYTPGNYLAALAVRLAFWPAFSRSAKCSRD